MSFGRQTHEIELRAKDGASNTFRLIGREGERAMQQLDRSAKQTSRSMADAKKAGKDLAIGVGAITGAFTLAARAAAEEEATFRRLEAAVEATGASYDQYAKQIDIAVAAGERLSFADDQTADALARMIGVTGDAAASLDAMGVAMDFARLRNIDLSTSADLIGKALAGNTVALSRYGVVIEEGATATEVLAAIQAKAAGQAEAYADSTQGGIDRVRNSIDNQIEAFGAWTGVTGQALATASEFTLQIALMGGGIVKLGSGLKGLAGAAGVGGLTAALGPAGLVLAAGAAAFALIKLADSGDTWRDAAEGSAQATDDLNQLLAQLAEQGSRRALFAADWIDQITVTTDGIDDLTRRMKELEDEQERLIEQEVELRQQNIGSGNARLDEIDATIAQRDAVEDHIAAIEREIEALGGLENANNEVKETKSALLEILGHTGPGFDAASESINRQREHLIAGRVTLLEFMNGVQLTASNLDDYDLAAIAATESTKALGDVAQGTFSHFRPFSTGTLELSDRLKDYTEGAERATLATRDLALVSGAKEITAAIIPAPIIETPDPMIITFYTELERAYANIGRGALTASEANLVFWDTQNKLIASQGPYNTQLSEYNSQLSAIDAAVTQIQEKQEAGIAISEREQAILDASGSALGRLTGGVEDATLARAELALQYAENMRVGDQLNENMRGQQEITGQLVEIVKALILALDGVPEEVKTQVALIGVESAIEQTNRLLGALASVPANLQSHILVTASMPSGLPVGGLFRQHGGLLPQAPVIVGEAGPEMLVGGQGGMVIPNSATRAHLREQGGGGDTFNNYGSLTVVANDPRGFLDQWRQQAIGGGRP